MRRSILNRVALSISIVALVSCKARKESTATVPARTTTEKAATVEKAGSLSAALISSINSGQFDFKTLSAKAKAELSIGNNSNDVSMNIRVKKDEIIWVSLTAIAGIEVARAMITPDSIKVLNKLQGVYLAKPFNFIYRYANRKISFGVLQALLVGNAIPGTPSTDAELVILDNQKRLNGDISGLIYSMTLNNENKLIENNLKDAASNQTVRASYNDFQSINGMKVPSSLRINSAAQDKPVQLEIKYSSVTVNDNLEFPFSVPKRYEVAN